MANSNSDFVPSASSQSNSPKKRKLESANYEPFESIIFSILNCHTIEDRAEAFIMNLVDIYRIDIEQAEDVEPEDLTDRELYKWPSFQFLQICMKRQIMNNEVMNIIDKELLEQDEDYSPHLRYIHAVYAFVNNSY